MLALILCCCHLEIIIIIFFNLFFFRAAYGGSQARGPNGAVAAGLQPQQHGIQAARLQPTLQFMATLDP